MRPLDRIEIRGFKSIHEMDLKLGPINVLIGPNGAGKSNFVSIFQLLNQMMERQLQVQVRRWGGADSILHFGQKHTPEMDLRLHFSPNSYYVKVGPSADGGLFLIEETCSYQGWNYTKPYTVYLASGATESGLLEEAAKTENKIAKSVLEAMRDWKVYHFHDTSPGAKVKQPQELNDNEGLRTDASNLAPYLYLLREKFPDHYKQIVGTIKLVAPFFRDFQLRPDPLRPGKILLEWLEVGSDTYFNANALSDGTLRFICTATLLLQPELPSMVLIDEPELGLHPFAIQVLAELLKQASIKSQVIVSTQSVTLVNHFTPEDVVVADREEDGSVFKRLGAEQIQVWLDNYGLGDLWEKNILGGRPA